MKQNLTEHVYFLFFNPLKVTDELEIESLGWVHGGELGGGELAVGGNRYHFLSPIVQFKRNRNFPRKIDFANWDPRSRAAGIWVRLFGGNLPRWWSVIQDHSYGARQLQRNRWVHSGHAI